MRPPTCQACGGRLLWALTVNAKLMPLNPGPDPGGNQAAYRDGTGGWRTRQLKAGEEPLRYEKRYMPHVATCLKPEAAVTPLRRVLPPNAIRSAPPGPAGTVATAASRRPMRGNPP